MIAGGGLVTPRIQTYGASHYHLYPQYCPEPVLAHITGSTWGGAMLKESFIGRGMRLEFRCEAARPIVTSPILEIEERVA